MSKLSYENKKFELNQFKAIWEEKRIKYIETNDLDEMGNKISIAEEYYETMEYYTNDKEYLQNLLLNNNIINVFEEIIWEDIIYSSLETQRLSQINNYNIDETQISAIENYVFTGSFEQILEDGTKVITLKEISYLIENEKLKQENINLMLAIAEIAETLN